MLAELSPPESHELQKEGLKLPSQNNGETILLVEDDASNRGALCRILRMEGWDVVEAVDGSKVMNLLETEKPGLILLDLVLPEVSGFDLLLKIGQNGQFCDIPIIVLTAKELSTEEKKLLREKVDCVFQKGNYSRNDLVEKIHSLIKEPSPQR